MLSSLFAAIDALRRKLTTEKATKHITSAAREIVRGDFDVRIPPLRSLSADDNYNVIIDCFNTMAELSGVAYPAYSLVLKKERRRVAPEILRLTDELMK